MLTSLRLATVTLSAALVLSACSALSPNATQFDYSASDGSQERIAGVLAHNSMLFTTEAGAEGAYIGSLSNANTVDVDVTLTWDDGTVTVTVPAGSTLVLGPEPEFITAIGTVATMPGLIADVEITVNGETSVFPVPVIDGTLPEYSHFEELLTSE